MTALPLAITMGDPAGVGPEIIVKAAAALRPRLTSGALRMVVIGSNAALEQARSQFTPGPGHPGGDGKRPGLARFMRAAGGTGR